MVNNNVANLEDVRIRYVRERLDATVDDIRSDINGMMRNIKGTYEICSKFMTEEEKEKIGFNESKFFNIANTMSNKILEIIKIFEEHNMSFYGNPYISQPVTIALIEYCVNACDELSKFVSSINITEEKIQTAKEEVRKAKKLSSKVKRYLGMDKTKYSFYNPEEIETARICYKNYLDLSDKVFVYNLPTDLVDSVVQYISEDYEAYREACGEISPLEKEMSQLGLEKLIPSLEQSLRERGYYAILPQHTYSEEEKAIDPYDDSLKPIDENYGEESAVKH